MLIVCPHCGTSYRVTAESLGNSGRSVRCLSCHQVWFEPRREPAGQPVQAGGADGIDPVLIRPPLNDVVEIGAESAPEETATTPHLSDADIPVDLASAPLADPDAAAPSIVPAADPAADRLQIEAPKSLERAAARSVKRPKARLRLTLSRHGLPAAICVLFLVLAGLVAGRQQVVRFLPQTASLYARIGMPVNLRGLAFENIKTARGMQDGVPMLVVEGDIVGTSGRHAEVPRLRFAVVDNAGKEIYAWTARPTRTLLPPGETLPFRSRLASPPADASGIAVRFFNRRDAQAGFM